MAMYTGYSSVGRTRKFTLVDKDLVIRDLINNFSIRQGEVPHRPEVGTKIWSFIFEPKVPEVEQQILEEVNRVLSLDPRIGIVDITLYPFMHGVVVDCAVFIDPEVTPERLQLYFDERNNNVSRLL